MSSISEEFGDATNVTMTYNGDGTVDTVVLTKFVSTEGSKTKTYTFTYDEGLLIGVDVLIEDVINP